MAKIGERSENWKHGHGGNPLIGKKASPTYISWCSMKSRCLNPNDPFFARYGARGINICSRWMCFELFLADMGERPSGTSLDRIDNDGPYELRNCRWSNARTQARNRNNNRLINWRGETQALAEWCELLGLDFYRMHDRIVRLGWEPEKAFTTPVRRQKTSHRLTAEQAAQIRHAQGSISAEICAEHFGVSRSTIYQIWQGRIWKNA